ncbi:hypothetical protein [Nonomuraea typhae]|uniref:Secreted protein n=1 Tax=Nonomuraea typhae TaxID=2603600 RepID=A0ABW7YLD4_9ACTN
MAVVSAFVMLLIAIDPATAATFSDPGENTSQPVQPSLLDGTPTKSGGDGEAFASLPSTAGAAVGDIRGCWVVAVQPWTLVYNTPPIRGEGYISRCTATKPDDCRIEADLEENLGGAWTVVANGPVKWGCNIGNTRANQSAFAYNCDHVSSSRTYRTRAYITVRVGAAWSVPAVATSGTASWWCE